MISLSVKASEFARSFTEGQARGIELLATLFRGIDDTHQYATEKMEDWPRLCKEMIAANEVIRANAGQLFDEASIIHGQKREADEAMETAMDRFGTQASLLKIENIIYNPKTMFAIFMQSSEKTPHLLAEAIGKMDDTGRMVLQGILDRTKANK